MYNMGMIHYIYKITLLCGELKDHYYIGKHSSKYENWKYYGSGLVLQNYYKKHGRIEGETFIKEILEYNSSSEENFEREKEILGDLWKTDPMCINLCAGGRGPTGHKVSEEARKKMSYWGGKTRPEETKKKMSESHKGVPHTAEHTKHAADARRGKKVKWYPRTPEWNKHISEANKGKQMLSIRGKNHYLAKPINQYTLNGEFVKRWDCAVEAKRALGKNINICEVCKGKRKQAGGFIWKYAS